MLCVSIIELVVLVLTMSIGIRQLVLLRKQMNNQHEERRRENTTSFMATWCSSLKKDTCIAEQVARKLNNDQCKKLYRHEAFGVADDIKADICKFCPLDKTLCGKCILKDTNIVDGKILTELRWHVVTYLNTLETIMVSWDLGIVDRTTIEEQFAFVRDTSRGATLSQFRHVAGAYPLIEKFIDNTKEKSGAPKSELSS